MSNKKNSVGLPIGGTSLIMAFMLLCFTVLSAVSYMSAQRDYVLSQKAAENIVEYYAADKNAENLLKDINNMIKNGDSAEKITQNFGEYDIMVKMKDGGINIQYSVPIKEEMVLMVNAEFSDEKAEIKAWKTVNNLIIEDEPIFLDLPAF